MFFGFKKISCHPSKQWASFFAKTESFWEKEKSPMLAFICPHNLQSNVKIKKRFFYILSLQSAICVYVICASFKTKKNKVSL